MRYYIIRYIDLYLSNIQFRRGQFDELVPDYYFHFDINSAIRFETINQAEMQMAEIKSNPAWKDHCLDVVKVD